MARFFATALVLVFTSSLVAQELDSAAGFPLSARERSDSHGARALAPRDGDADDAADGGVADLPDWQALGPFGGDVEDINVSPVDPNIVLAGIAPAGSSGGLLYRSTDGGATWTRVAALNGRSVYDIAFTTAGVAYIGTDDGVWKSTDGGIGWTPLALGIGVNDTVHKVAIDPNDPLVIWAGVDDHGGVNAATILRSVNGGTTWTNRTPAMTPMACLGIVVDPANSSKIYACFGGAFGGGQFWVSTNSGASGSWVNRSAGLPTRPMKDVVHDGARVMVCGGQLFGGQTFGLFQTVNDGVNWTPMHDGTWPILAISDIDVNPTDVNTICVSSLGAGIYRSTNGGVNWTFNTAGSAGLSVNAVRFAPGSGTRVLAGASSVGALTSNDGAGSFTNSSSGIASLDVFAIAANPNNGQELAIAFQGLNNGGVYTSTNGGQNWSLEPLPGTRYSAVGFAPDGTLHAISSGPSSIAPEGFYRRNGGTWTGLGPNQGTLFESELFTMRFSQTNPNLIVAGGNDFGVAGFEMTTWLYDAAVPQWTKTHEAGSSLSVRDIEIVDDGSDQTMVASYLDNSGGNHGGALRSINGGTSWDPANVNLSATFQGASLCGSPDSPTKFYMANSYNPSGGPPGGGLVVTTDAGASWSPAGLATSTMRVVEDPLDAADLYMTVNTTLVIRSEDHGASAAPFNTGLTGVTFTRDLSYAPGPGPRLLLATPIGAYARDLAVCTPCDTNCDGSVNQFDIVPFVNTLVSQAGCSPCAADSNEDGSINQFDIAGFVDCLSP